MNHAANNQTAVSPTVRRNFEKMLRPRISSCCFAALLIAACHCSSLLAECGDSGSSASGAGGLLSNTDPKKSQPGTAPGSLGAASTSERTGEAVLPRPGRITRDSYAAWTRFPSDSTDSQSPQPPAAPPPPGASQEELVKKALDPTASPMSFLFRDVVTPNYYGRGGSGNSIQFQPAVPFRAFGSTNILRVTLPYNTGGVPGKGLGSIQVFNVTVFPFKGGRIGVGPVMNFANNPALTKDRFQIGPAMG